MQEELKNLLNMAKTEREIDNSLSDSEREIKKLLYSQEPKLRRIHEKMMSVVEKYGNDESVTKNNRYYPLLLLECTHLQSMLCNLYGIPNENIIEELKNADI